MGAAAEAGRLLVINAGSSSLKFKLFAAAPLVAGLGGLIERIGDAANSTLSAKLRLPDGSTQKWEDKTPITNHTTALEKLMRFLGDNVSSSIEQEVAAVGHRIVHGLDIAKAVLLDDAVIKKIEKAAALAPLHNPPGLAGIAAAQKVFGPAVPHVAVFDTAFHQTLPPHAYMYALPMEYYKQHSIRRYGFHGTSHKYLAETAAAMMGRPLGQLNAITCHLGAGSSVTAVERGRSVDTSMGLTPLEGLVMGTRCGDLDPAVPLHIMRTTGVGAAEMDAILNKRSGLLGLCGNNDLRNVIERRAKGDPEAALAMDVFIYRVRKYVGAYTTALNGHVDAIVFSAGIGENSPLVRALVCGELQRLGVIIDAEANAEMVGGRQGFISKPESRVKVLVVPTDEELSIAQQTVGVVFGDMGEQM
ncbi:acetate kinase [Raphidocelis subcapitata]|uniref:Probable acetate kinase n=1 Tax=Raphidocelis subcapitata TaxID=307507 RepID=A0A2V0NTE8_9CHLO|nr:acetate kinase [Raphidocelis subcapitata]|eukprot:GBF90589.1 acetate kinase [Raphidocelis subcapitata]